MPSKVALVQRTDVEAAGLLASFPACAATAVLAELVPPEHHEPSAHVAEYALLCLNVSSRKISISYQVTTSVHGRPSRRRSPSSGCSSLPRCGRDPPELVINALHIDPTCPPGGAAAAAVEEHRLPLDDVRETLPPEHGRLIVYQLDGYRLMKGGAHERGAHERSTARTTDVGEPRTLALLVQYGASLIGSLRLGYLTVFLFHGTLYFSARVVS